MIISKLTIYSNNLFDTMNRNNVLLEDKGIFMNALIFIRWRTLVEMLVCVLSCYKMLSCQVLVLH